METWRVWGCQGHGNKVSAELTLIAHFISDSHASRRYLSAALTPPLEVGGEDSLLPGRPGSEAVYKMYLALKKSFYSSGLASRTIHPSIHYWMDTSYKYHFRNPSDLETFPPT